MNNHKCPEELVAAIERSRVLESLTPAQAAAFDDVIAEKNRQIERAYDGLNYQDRQITELRARVAELEAERAELVKDRERLIYDQKAKALEEGAQHLEKAGSGFVLAINELRQLALNHIRSRDEV